MDFKPDVSYSSSPEMPKIDCATALDTNISSILSFLESPLAPTENADLPDTQTVKILKGVVAYVEVRTGTENRSKAVCRELINMGASVETKFTNDSEVTHVVFKDGKKSTLDRAIKKGIYVVSVLWVDSCKQNQEHVLESLFPAGQPETKGTPIMVARLKKSKSMQPKDFDEEVANSAEKNVKNRKRLASKVEREERYKMVMESPSILKRGLGTPVLHYKPSYLVSETCPKSPELSVQYSITVPDTPPSMRERMSHIQARQQVIESPIDVVQDEDEPITDTPHVNIAEDDVAVLQRRLFGTLETDADNEDPLLLSTSSSRCSPASTSVQKTTSSYVKSLINKRESPRLHSSTGNFGIRQDKSPMDKTLKKSSPHGTKRQTKTRRSRDSNEPSLNIKTRRSRDSNELSLNVKPRRSRDSSELSVKVKTSLSNTLLGTDKSLSDKGNERRSYGNKENEVLEKGKSVKKKKLMKLSFESPCSQLMSPTHVVGKNKDNIEEDDASFHLENRNRRKVKATKKRKTTSGSTRDPSVLFTNKQMPETSKNTGKKRKKHRRSSIGPGVDKDNDSVGIARKRTRISEDDLADSDTELEERIKSPEIKEDPKDSKSGLYVPESVETDDTFVPESMDMMGEVTCVVDSEAPDAADQVTVVPETVPEDYGTYLDDEDEDEIIPPPAVNKGRHKSHSGNKVEKVLPVRGRRRSELIKKSCALCKDFEKDTRGCSVSKRTDDDTGENKTQPPSVGDVDTPKVLLSKDKSLDILNGRQRRKSCINTPSSDVSSTVNRKRMSVMFSDTIVSDEGKPGKACLSKNRRKSIQKDADKVGGSAGQVIQITQKKISKASDRRKSASLSPLSKLGSTKTSKSEEQRQVKETLTMNCRRRSGMLNIDSVKDSADKKAKRRSSTMVVVTKLSSTEKDTSSRASRRRSAVVSSRSSADLDSSSEEVRPSGSKGRRSNLGKKVKVEEAVVNSSDVSPEIALQAPIKRSTGGCISTRRRSVRFSTTTEIGGGRNPGNKTLSSDDQEDSLTDVSALTTQNHTLTPSGRTKQLLAGANKNRRRSGRLLLQAKPSDDTMRQEEEENLTDTSVESVEQPRLTSTPGRSISEGLSTEEVALHDDETTLSGLSCVGLSSSVFVNLTSSRRSIEEFVNIGKNKKKSRACSLPVSCGNKNSANHKRRRSGSLTGNGLKLSEKKETSGKRLHKSESEAGPPKTWKKVAIQPSKANSQPKGMLVTTNLHFDEQDMVSSVVKQLGGFTVEETITTTSTHVVSGRNRRTLNILYAMANGLWVLSLEWVFKSLEAGTWLEEEEFEVDYFPAVKLSRVERGLDGERYCPHLFTEEKAIFVGDNTAPPRKHLVKLIKLCGGKVVSSQRQASLCIGAVSTEDVVSLSEQWVLDSICQMSAVPYYAYKLNCPSRMEREPSPDY